MRVYRGGERGYKTALKREVDDMEKFGAENSGNGLCSMYV